MNWFNNDVFIFYFNIDTFLVNIFLKQILRVNNIKLSEKKLISKIGAFLLPQILMTNRKKHIIVKCKYNTFYRSDQNLKKLN